MNMKKADSVNEDNMIVDGQHVVPRNAFGKLLPIFTIDIVYVQYMTDASNVGGRQCLTKRPIHVHLAFSLLKVDQRAWGETPMPRAGMAADARAVG
jgi:hypothetical protein